MSPATSPARRRARRPEPEAPATPEPEPAATPKRATAADLDVGSRISALRAASGMSQTALAGALGISFQQVQKYETGKNRVGASRLQAIAEHLGVPVSTFFAEPETAADPPGLPDEHTFLRAPGAVELLRAYAGIADERVQRDLVALVKLAARIGRASDGA